MLIPPVYSVVSMDVGGAGGGLAEQMGVWAVWWSESVDWVCGLRSQVWMGLVWVDGLGGRWGLREAWEGGWVECRVVALFPLFRKQIEVEEIF